MVLYVTLRTALHSLISVITGVTMTVVFWATLQWEKHLNRQNLIYPVMKH